MHEEESPHNSQDTRTKGKIFFGPSGNLQGGYKCIELNSGKKIVRRNWDLITMPDTVIARANTSGSNQPKIFTFTEMYGRLIGEV